MSNTLKRILSAVVLIAMIGTCVYLGQPYTIGFMFVFGLIAVDEIYTNFIRKPRLSFFYPITVIIFALPYLLLLFTNNHVHVLENSIYFALALNLILIMYLFLVDMESDLINRIGQKLPFLSALLILFPMLILGLIINLENWRGLIGVLLFVNFGMDTGAWFFGKNFGKHKLWPAVSPNKTVEGLFGGILTSCIFGGLSWYVFVGGFSIKLFIAFGFLGLLSQVGDLVQSKIKRQYNIKDSSNLIPGHGGVYDRIDSLLFLSPFYLLVLKLLYLKQ